MGRRRNLADLASDEFLETDAQRPAVAAVADTEVTRAVPTASVALNPLNKRPPGEDDDIAAMADTIRAHGVIQPLVVCSAKTYLAEFPNQAGALESGADWVVLIGNRRLRAARSASLDRVSIIVNDETVASMFEVILIENGVRRDLPPVLEAEAMAEALKKTSISQRELAKRIGRSHVYVAQRLALLGLIPALRTALEVGELKIELAREFGGLPVAEQEAIVAAGKPYRLHGGNAVTSRRRSIRASTPAVAAESLRERFSPDELAELIRLLTGAAEPG